MAAHEFMQPFIIIFYECKMNSFMKSL